MIAFGAVFLGHGSREAVAVAQFEALVEHARALAPAGMRLAHGYIELVPPTMDEAIDAAVALLHADVVASGAVRAGVPWDASGVGLAVVPCVLSAAGHVRVDVRDAVARAQRRHPWLAIAQAEHLGAHAAIVDVLAQRVGDALGARAANDAVLLFATRGSSDARAVADCRDLAAAVGARAGVGAHEVGFFAVAEPGVAEALGVCGRTGARTVVVLPHLMADGKLAREVREVWVPLARAAAPDVDFVLADVLGPDPRVAHAALSLAIDALNAAQVTHG